MSGTASLRGPSGLDAGLAADEGAEGQGALALSVG
jgi:hypothetical protein